MAARADACLFASREVLNLDRISLHDETSGRLPTGDPWRDWRSGVAVTLRSIPHLRLLGLRTARHAAELDTTGNDQEITRRVILQPQMRPEVHELMRRSGVLSRRLRGELATLLDGEATDAAEVRFFVSSVRIVQVASAVDETTSKR